MSLRTKMSTVWWFLLARIGCCSHELSTLWGLEQTHEGHANQHTLADEGNFTGLHP